MMSEIRDGFASVRFEQICVIVSGSCGISAGMLLRMIAGAGSRFRVDAMRCFQPFGARLN